MRPHRPSAMAETAYSACPPSHVCLPRGPEGRGGEICVVCGRERGGGREAGVGGIYKPGIGKELANASTSLLSMVRSSRARPSLSRYAIRSLSLASAPSLALMSRVICAQGARSRRWFRKGGLGFKVQGPGASSGEGGGSRVSGARSRCRFRKGGGPGFKMVQDGVGE